MCMSPVYTAMIVGMVVFAAVAVWAPAEPPDVHAEIQQRLLEAELGSATTFHFAAGPNSRVPDGRDAKLLLAKLTSSSPESRWQAAEQLAIRRDTRAVEAVIRAMRDPRGTIRVCVMASALGHLRDPRALSALTEAMFDTGNRDLRLCAIQSLGMIGDPAAVPALIEALQTNNTPVAAANAIARIGDERGVVPIIQAAGDSEKRLWMIMALGELGSSSALPFLQTVVRTDKDSTGKAAQEARWKISRLSMTQPVEALATVLEKESVASRRMWASFRLGESRQAMAVPVLMQALNDESTGVRSRAAAALIRIGDPALPSLRAQLNQGTSGERLYVAAILGYAGKRQDIGLLQLLVQEQVSVELTRVAQRSIELINSFMKPDDSFIEFAKLDGADK